MINAAIIGCGAIAPLHADAIRRNGVSNLKAVADIDIEKTYAYRDEYTCDVYKDYRDMLKDGQIDVVHICTPHHLHCEMILDCLSAGKHVLTEKPICINMEEIERILEASRKSEKKVGVCFQNRYNRTSIVLKEYLDSGKAGEIKGAKMIVTWNRDAGYYKQSSWRGKWETEGGGVLINQAIHTMDLLIWMLGDVDFVEGSIATRLIPNVIEVENTAEGIIRFQSGVNASFYASNCYCSNSPVEIEIVCEKAVIQLRNELTIFEKEGDTIFASNEEKESKGKSCWGTSHEKLINDFYDSITKNKKFPLDPQEGSKALELILKLYENINFI